MKKNGISSAWYVFGFCIILFMLLIFLAFYLSNHVNLSPQEQETHLECLNNACAIVPGVGINECAPEGSFCGCVDTDAKENYTGGINFFEQGIVRNETTSKTDRCASDGKIIEYSCQNDATIALFQIACQSLGNYTCHEGACFPDYAEFEECNDTDGGLLYFVDGRASNGKVRISDYCLPDGQLGEVYCSRNTEEILIDLIDCKSLGSFVCESGKCAADF